MPGLNHNTKLLLHFDGRDGIQTLADYATGQNHQPSQAGAQIIVANNHVFGDTAIYLDGDGDYLTIPDSTDWDIYGDTTGTWTIDFWYKASNAVAAAAETLIGQYADATHFWSINRIASSGTLTMWVRNGEADGGPYTMYELSDTSFEDDEWHHVALIKIEDEVALYIDGVQRNYVVFPETGSTVTFAGSLYIGSVYGGGDYFKGSMDEIRIQNSNPFSAAPNVGKTNTILVPTAAHTADANTKLLLHFNPDLDDSSGSSKTVTRTGGARTPARFGNAAAHFNGSNQYFTLADGVDWAMGTSDFTLEFWVSWDPAANKTIWCQRDGTTFVMIQSVGTVLRFVSQTSSTVNCRYDILLTSFTAYKWHHVAYVRNGTAFACYIDGTSISFTETLAPTVAIGSGTIANVGAQLEIGAENGSNHFQGYLDCLRYKKDVVVYSSNFTPPTTELVWDNYTTLIMTMNSFDVSGDGSVNRGKSYHIASFAATAQLDTATKKWGDSSLLLDGNSDYVLVPADSTSVRCLNPFGSLSDNWTIDYWMYVNSVADSAIMETNNNVVETYFAHHLLTGPTQLRFYLRLAGTGSVGDFDMGSGVIGTGTWFHIAVIKIGATIGGYIDGTQLAFSTLTAAVNTSNKPLYIGARATLTDRYFNGSLDEFRIQKGNYFNANPVVGLTDTITVPTEAYNTDPGFSELKHYITVF
jgi:hypothetical protein